MQKNSFTLINQQAMTLHIYEWLPEISIPIKGLVQIVHGMAETADRYTRVASALCNAGYAVYAHDQRGHGKTAKCMKDLGDCGEDAFNGMTNDIIEVTTYLQKKYPSMTHYLFGHSMGSFLTQRIIEQHAEAYSGFILSGTNGPRSNLGIAKNIAQVLLKFQGASHHSLLLNAIVFGRYNRRISPVRTPFDWLSRDEAEVDKYIQDPYCGEVCTTGFFRDFFGLLKDIQHPSGYHNITKNKPIYLFAGDMDPVGSYGKGVTQLHKIYHDLGVVDLECRLYPGGRHEMLNEINRDEVTTDLLDWIEKHTK
ncbi:alpha/beta hydrolase [Paenibacillus crassostreae]|uniref:Alpha/beta hydrolase n=1 Tax=Paenibacillus crassostreae TaxID=1763538 RepID=A0A167GHE9_9BACL|nr:alpha/beta hydrolase [Paenibacillus crassostreae]AOZ92117.1 alpha/beta hydrolase [Paenibacillus crassostreae]OAB77578.1 alpha/beta hydrolase [Paenibacillus crassostreae]